jgi:cytochrome c
VVAAVAAFVAATAWAQPGPASRAAAPAAAHVAPPGGITGVGRPATAKEVSAWDIDVRPDFEGLPKGSGSVAKGQDVWEAKCASCHGVFGESNEVFSPIAGGTTKEDVASGRVARLRDEGFPGRTTLMKLATVSTLWDYINRAMPWNTPKSLTSDEVYAVTAFILNLGGVVPDDFTLSERNIAEVQKRLPNRDGMTVEHAMWPGAGLGRRKVDVVGVACMTNCATEQKVASLLPDHARNAHGNLAEQNRTVGAQRGADTTRPAPATLAESAARAATVAAAAPAAAARPAAPAAGSPFALAQQHACTACHGLDARLVGPSFVEIAKKHAGRGDALDYLTGKIKAGGTGVWGAVPMPPQTLGDADAKAIAQWLAAGAKP